MLSRRMPLSRGSTPLRPLILGLNGNCTDSEKRDTTDENHHPHHGQPHLKLLANRPFCCRGKLSPVDPGLPSYSTRDSRSSFTVSDSDRFLQEISLNWISWEARINEGKLVPGLRPLRPRRQPILGSSKIRTHILWRPLRASDSRFAVLLPQARLST